MEIDVNIKKEFKKLSNELKYYLSNGEDNSAKIEELKHRIYLLQSNCPHIHKDVEMRLGIKTVFCTDCNKVVG